MSRRQAARIIGGRGDHEERGILLRCFVSLLNDLAVAVPARDSSSLAGNRDGDPCMTNRASRPMPIKKYNCLESKLSNHILGSGALSLDAECESHQH